MMEERNEFEEYKMNLIAFQGDVITTSVNHDSVTDMGDLEGSGDEGWPEEPGME